MTDRRFRLLLIWNVVPRAPPTTLRIRAESFSCTSALTHSHKRSII